MTVPDMNKHDDRMAERKHGPRVSRAQNVSARRGASMQRGCTWGRDNRREAKQRRLFRERDTCIIPPLAERTDAFMRIYIYIYLPTNLIFQKLPLRVMRQLAHERESADVCINKRWQSGEHNCAGYRGARCGQR